MNKLSKSAIALCAVALVSGCSLGGGKPVNLYQFGNGGDGLPAAAAVTLQQPITIIYAGATFDRQSSGDRILTATGNQVSYVADARWAAPAQEMFDNAAVRQIEALSPQLRVVRVGAPTKADYMLAIDVRAFEASYASGADAAPEIIVLARAKLMRVSDRTIIGDWPIEQRENAQENRITAIVAAFDRASSSVTGQIAGNVRQMLGAG